MAAWAASEARSEPKSAEASGANKEDWDGALFTPPNDARLSWSYC
jgi:hypothetical protein